MTAPLKLVHLKPRFCSELRIACIASWNALLRQTPRPEALKMTHAAWAGYELAKHDGDAASALVSVPSDSDWFEPVRVTLETILREEGT